MEWLCNHRVRRIEVVPIGDLKAHVVGEHAKTCWCGPGWRRLPEESSDLPAKRNADQVVHNALDGRDAVEKYGVM